MIRNESGTHDVNSVSRRTTNSSARRPPLNVLHVITGLNQGGAESALYRLLAAQSDPRLFHVVSLTTDGVFGARLRDIGVQVSSLGAKSFYTAPFDLFRLMHLLRKLGPDVVQTWMYHADLLGGIAARLLGLRVCWGVRQSNLSKKHNKRLTLCVVRICALLSRLVPSKIVTCSLRAAETHRAVGYADRFVVIPNGLNMSLFTFSPLGSDVMRRALGIPATAHVVGHVGRSDPQKDHQTLIAAFAQVLLSDQSAYLLLIGKDLSHGNVYLDGLLAHVAIKDRVIGLGSRGDVAELMSVMDVFVLSSVGEAFPNVVAEAMACGVVCVVTDVGDSAKIVGDTGWVRQPGDVMGLAEDIIAALGEPAEVHAARKYRARQRIEDNYDVGRMVVGYQTVWNDVARGGNACAE